MFYNTTACASCPCKCTVSRYYRFEIDMPEAEFTTDYDDWNLSVNQIKIKPDKNFVKARKSIVEHPFGTLKRNMDAGYCLTRGLRNVGGEFSLAFLAYNMKRAINIVGSERLMEYIST